MLWHAGSAEEEDVYLSVLRKAFNDLGDIEGKNIQLEHRFPAENPGRFRTLARELVESKPDAIIAVTGVGAAELKRSLALFRSYLSWWRTRSASDLSRVCPTLAAMRPVGSAYDNRLERKASGVVEGSGSEPVACRDFSRCNRSVQGTPDQNLSVCGRGVGIVIVALAEITMPDDIEPVFSKIAQDRAMASFSDPEGLLFVQRARIGAVPDGTQGAGIGLDREEVPTACLCHTGRTFPIISGAPRLTSTKY